MSIRVTPSRKKQLAWLIEYGLCIHCYGVHNPSPPAYISVDRTSQESNICLRTTMSLLDARYKPLLRGLMSSDVRCNHESIDYSIKMLDLQWV
ncbi:hypothetical protein TNCV_2014111 [Trichonephila clavipes]|nr:hypothetical protein TNCV_2014111 [Trichonephila clavipes]